MTPFHLLLTLLVVIVWGVNFVVMKVGLRGFPPLFLCALRFSLVAMPAIFFVPRPQAPWRLVAAFGIIIFALQFGFIFSGVYLGMPPGLASLVVQTQVVFTLALAALVFRERPSVLKMLGAAIALSGIGLVAFNSRGNHLAPGFILTLLAALSWSVGNLIAKRIGPASPVALVVWGSLYALPPTVLFSLIIEGPTLIGESLSHVEWISLAALAYLVFVSTHFGYSVWAFLVARYPASTVAPFALLIPVFGFLSSALFLGEEIAPWKLQASCLVILGLCLNVFEPKIRRRFGF